MGRIVSNLFLSLDGVVENPGEWQGDLFNDEMGELMGAALARTRAFLMGHRLYDEWSAYWPPVGEEDFGAFINPIQKYVLAHEPFEATWQNTTVVAGDEASVAEQVRALKDATDGDVAMSGSATTAAWLAGQGLLDELVVQVHPVVVGSGRRLFEGADGLRMTLEESRALSNGVLHLRYAPTR
jgi:dihydrofolate reductase